MEVPQQLQLAIQRATDAASGEGELAQFASEMVRLLTAVADDLGATSTHSRPARRGMGQVEYLVEGSGATETLTEYRGSGKSMPHRCPKALYDAIVGVLGQAERPLSAEDIAAGVEKMMGVRPAEYQLRVPLRLWITADPPLVLRVRARYRAADTKFTTAAETLWNGLRQQNY